MCISSYFLSLLMQSLHDNYVESGNAIYSLLLTFHFTLQLNVMSEIQSVNCGHIFVLSFSSLP